MKVRNYSYSCACLWTDWLVYSLDMLFYLSKLSNYRQLAHITRQAVCPCLRSSWPRKPPGGTAGQLCTRNDISSASFVHYLTLFNLRPGLTKCIIDLDQLVVIHRVHRLLARSHIWQLCTGWPCWQPRQSRAVHDKVNWGPGVGGLDGEE